MPNDRDLEDTRQPPDGPERVDCPDCGEEMEYFPYYLGSFGKYTKCINPFCPGKHEGIAKEMTEKILELQDDLMRLKRSKK